MPTTINPVKRLRTNAAKADSASKTSSTTMQGPSIRWVVSENIAPARYASAAKSWPSTVSPLSAKKMQPGVARRESNTGAFDTNKSLSQCNSPPTNKAISAAVKVIISCPRLLEQALRDHQMDD